MKEVATHCPYCALQCGLMLRERPGGVEVGPRDFPTNRGGLCQKGWTAAQLLDHPDRLTAPLIGGQPATWEDAYSLIIERVLDIQRRHSNDAIAVFGGGGLTNEKVYSLGKFARVALGTRHIDYNGRFCMSSAAAAANKTFGLDRGLPFPLADLSGADTLLLVGANVAETMPPFARYLVEQKAKGGTLIVVDPRATATARGATLHLQPTPGTDLALALGLLHIAVAEGLIDGSYVDDRTTGWEGVRASVAGYWPARVERITGVPVSDLEFTARALSRGKANRAIILTARGAEQHSKGVDTVIAFINLALALGLPGRPGSGFGTLTGQGNGQGGREHGQKADQLPGYRSIDDPAARAHVASVWGVEPDTIPGAGISAYEMLNILGTQIKGLMVFGSNPAVSAPNTRHIKERLRSLDFLVVCDFVLSETAALADVVLPVAQWAEEDGTMTNLEGRVIRRRALRKPPPGIGTDLAVLAELGARLSQSNGESGLSRHAAYAADVPRGKPPSQGVRFDSDPHAVFEELRRATAGGAADYGGVTWERVDAEDGVFWPCPTADRAGTPRLFETSFPTPDGRARMLAVEHRPVAEEVDDDFPLYLTTGRVLSQYQSGAQTRRILQGEVFVEMHPDLASRMGFAEGAPVRVISRRGEVLAPARLSETIRPDTVFAPFHYPGVNDLTNPALDPTSRMPEFKVCAVRLEPA
ncbi:MAG TPA: molybdopterin oxidoreductase family protein [Candidatus Limnocylindrales bacterium]|nr:molybdopterin oxidoreductase family protein [Candidatus Limnocylindrales bacterium]